MGGCSEGNYASFNCTGYCGDEAEHVQKNREILCELLPQKPLELIIPHQTHSTNIGVIDDACIRVNKENRLEDIDAIITGTSRLLPLYFNGRLHPGVAL